MTDLNKIYLGKTVLVTGHTGFKGSWLCLWLEQLGAKVVGLSLSEAVSIPSMYEELSLSNRYVEYLGDIRNSSFVKETVEAVRPDFIFHLAAQPLVGVAFQSPVETFSTNALGTVSLLNALRDIKFRVNCVFITSDKAYDNKEMVWGYREVDPLGGIDPYSASKGMAELAIRSFVGSYFPQAEDSAVKIAVARAGNVIGGGDWAEDRLIPDCVRCWANNQVLAVRNISSTRPWQHVLEPVGGYLLLGAYLENNLLANGDAYNFGPRPEVDEPVHRVLAELSRSLNGLKWVSSKSDFSAKESTLLKLSCEKAKSKLNWQSQLNFSETIDFTANWYKAYYQSNGVGMYEFSVRQLNEYISLFNKGILIGA